MVIGRGVWKFNADRALQQDEVQIVDLAGTVLAVAEITGLTKSGDRYALEGRLLSGDARVGKPTSTPHPSRNSVAYFETALPFNRAGADEGRATVGR